MNLNNRRQTDIYLISRAGLFKAIISFSIVFNFLQPTSLYMVWSLFCLFELRYLESTKNYMQLHIS